ncbi:MAG: YceI family protein [Planctomycetota bacterium]
MQAIERDQVRAWIDSAHPFTLLDVLPADVHARWHIPGSRNACIYEVSFADDVAALGLDPAAPIVVYGAGPRDESSVEAAAMLASLGFKDVQRFAGGREAWAEAGLTGEGTAETWEGEQPPVFADGVYEADPERSLVRWTGRNNANSHWGSVAVASGRVVVRDGEITEGEAIVDLERIEVDDIRGEMAAALIRHLASPDFFDVANHATARLRVDAVEPVPGSAPGQANASVRGALEIRGVSHPLSFAATVGANGEDGLGVQGAFQFDRTRWGSRYGSGKLFHFLGGHLVHDGIQVTVRMVATRRTSPS